MVKNLEERLNKYWGWYKKSDVDYSIEDFKESWGECEELVAKAFLIEFISYKEYDECKEILEKYANVIYAVMAL